MPAEKGSVMPSAAAAPTAASAALPPARRISSPAREASKSTVETAPPRPRARAVLTVVGPAGRAARAKAAAGADGDAPAGAAVRASAAATAPVVATMLQRWRYDDMRSPLARDSLVRKRDQYSTSPHIAG